MTSEIKAFTKKLKRLPREVTRDGTIADTIGQEFCSELLSRVPQGIPATEGGLNDDPFRIDFKRTQTSVTPFWTGDQIYYLEFGAGSPAVGGYPDQERMSNSITQYGPYSPRPDGHNLGVYWRLPSIYWKRPDILQDGSDSKVDYYVTKGWAPYAPFYLTMKLFELGSMHPPVAKRVHEIVENKL